MKPGDVLRKRILRGIENADYFLVIISETSINSSWVEYELNSAMIEEIEKQQVKVIPSIAGSIEHKQLPLDLRTKYSLDFRNDEAFQKSIRALIDLVQPEVREHREILKRLRNLSSRDTLTIQELRRYALKYSSFHDIQAIQVAALKRLTDIGGFEAVLAITERIMDTWGMQAIKTAIKALGKLHNDGGLLALTATLYYDDRFYLDKLRALHEGAIKLGSREAYLTLESILDELENQYGAYGLESHFYYKKSISQALEQLVNVSLDDIQYGAILAKSTSPIISRTNQITMPEKHILDQARKYAEKRIPGLIMLKSKSGEKLFKEE